MKVIIDERETELYEKCYSIANLERNNTYAFLEKRVLDIGDILVQTDGDKDVMIIERKTFADLLASIKDGRYEEQSYRLIHSSGFPRHNIVYIIEGIFSQVHSLAEKRILYSAITSLNYFKGFSVFRTSSVRETSELVVWMADKIDRNFMKGIIPSYLQADRHMANPPLIIQPTQPTEQSQDAQEPPNYCTVVKKAKKENINSSNIGTIMLSQIPGISSTTAMAIMKGFSSFPDFLEALNENPDFLNDITYETNGKKRKITKTSVESIKLYMCKKREPYETAMVLPSDETNDDVKESSL